MKFIDDVTCTIEVMTKPGGDGPISAAVYKKFDGCQRQENEGDVD
jgi:hypothetical protein